MGVVNKPVERASAWDQAALLALALAIVVGTLVRLVPVIRNDFPVNDGGLFYVMAQDLLRAGYRLPWVTTYNNAGIPFAYPPLPLYLTALLAQHTSWHILAVLHAVPAIVSIVTIPAFFLLSRAVLQSPAQANFAVLAFALFPCSFVQLIKGGGMTRAPGLLAALLTLWCLHRLYTRGERRYALAAGMLAGLTVLCHLEMAWFTAYSAAVFFLFFGRSRRAVLDSTLAAALALVLTAPWWVTLLVRHGLTPMIATLETGTAWYLRLSSLAAFNASGEPFVGLLAVIGLLGLLVCLAERRFFLPTWLAVMVLLDSRGEIIRVSVPLAMLTGVGIDLVVLRSLRPAGQATEAGPETSRGRISGWTRHLGRLLPAAVLVLLLLYELVSALAAPMMRDSPLSSVSLAERQAMRWAAANTPASSTFAVVTAESWWTDSITEWFPALTQRTSAATVQGTEWLPGHQFNRRLDSYNALQECAYQQAACLDEWARTADVAFSHVYVSKAPVRVDLTEFRACCDLLLDALRRSDDYELIYDEPGAAIFVQSK